MTDAPSRALVALIALSLATTALTAAAPAVPLAAGAGALVLAGLKADVILTRYLGLAGAPVWRRGFRAALVLLVGALGALWLVPVLA
jgi:hypothetical protein